MKDTISDEGNDLLVRNLRRSRRDMEKEVIENPRQQRL